MTKRSKTAGITQLELLLSLALMALLAILIANAMNYTRQAMTRAAQPYPITEEALGRERLRSWIENIPLEFSGLTASEHLSGTADQLEFRALIHSELFWAGELTQVRLVRNPQGTNPILSAMGQSGPEAKLKTHEFTMAEQVETMSIRYFGRKSSESQDRWHDDWADPVTLPLLVKIEWARADGRAIPPLTLEPAKSARQRYMSMSSLVPPG